MSYLRILFNAYLHIPVGWGCFVILLYIGICMFIIARQEGSVGLQVNLKKWVECLGFCIYILLVLGGTLLCRSVGDVYRYELQFLWSYWETFVNGNLDLLPQMLYNVLIFIPWGIWIPVLFSKGNKAKWIIYSALLQSLIIEVSQLVFKCGLFEFDDVFHNTLGALVGFGIWKCVRCWRG